MWNKGGKNMSEFDLEFRKFNLQEGDNLIIKVNTSGMSEDQAVESLKKVYNDPFTEYVRNQGHQVFVTYTGVDIQILRIEENDKIAVYCDVSRFTDSEEEEKYLSFVKEKLSELGDKVIIIPTEGCDPRFRIVKESQLNLVENNDE